MSWQDRDYHREEAGARPPGSGLLSLFFGSLPLGTWFGIRVLVHASMFWFIGLTVLFAYSQGFGIQSRLTSMVALFGIVLLHEFGHCFASRWVGGNPQQILMWPLGGLAYASAPPRPWPTFVTVAGGPAVNVIICVICAAALYYLTGRFVRLNPFNPLPPIEFFFTSAAFYLWWIFQISYMLLLFNLLPIYPLDGGQILHSILWPRMGYYRATMFSTATGMAGAVLLGIWGLVSSAFLLVIISINGFMTCMQMRAAARQMRSEGFDDQYEYAASLREDNGTQRTSTRAARKLQKQMAAERAEQAKVDAILQKVSEHGMNSLSWSERRALKKATERQRKRDEELERIGKRRRG